MVATVMGRYSKPYNVDGKSGISCRLSLHCGEYVDDQLSGAKGSGDKFIEVKCPQNIFDQLEIGDEISAELDDGSSRIKTAMIQIEVADGRKAFVPLGD